MTLSFTRASKLLGCRFHASMSTTTFARRSCRLPVTLSSWPLPSRPVPTTAKRYFSFTFAGPRKLDEIMKKELVEGTSQAELADLWYNYHEQKDGVLGLILDGATGKRVLERAGQCPFFIQPVFRDDGFFMLLSQYQAPAHFLLAFLEDYKMDPHSATPLLTFSVFDDYADEKDTVLVRCDVLNKNIEEHEARKVVSSVMANYSGDEEFPSVKSFNKKPDLFDIDDFISRMNDRWKQEPNTVS